MEDWELVILGKGFGLMVEFWGFDSPSMERKTDYSVRVLLVWEKLHLERYFHPRSTKN